MRRVADKSRVWNKKGGIDQGAKGELEENWSAVLSGMITGQRSAGRPQNCHISSLDSHR
jgi:hypothetical protein